MPSMRRSIHANGLETWHFDLGGGQVTAAITTRAGGASVGPYTHLNLGFHVGDAAQSVAANRQLVCEALGIDLLTVGDQQHSNRVRYVDQRLSGAGHDSAADAVDRLGVTDGLLTDIPGVALGIMVADCAPVVIYDPEHHALGVAHVGRGGAVTDVIGSLISEMQATFQSTPANLWAGVGPCIRADTYEINGQALEETRAAFDAHLLAPTSHGAATFDLRSAVLDRLVGHGVDPRQIEVDERTTTDDEALFSDRRARPCGRFMLVAALQDR